MKSYKVETVNYERLLEAVKKDSIVYGDLLQFLTIRPYDLPARSSATIMTVASFYETLVRYYGSILESFLALALLKKGFSDAFLENVEPEFTHDEMISFHQDAAVSGFLDPEKQLNFYKPGTEREEITIYILEQRPTLQNDGELGYSMEQAVDELIRELTDENGEDAGPMGASSAYIIPDPFLFHLFRDEINKSKTLLEEKLPSWQFLSAEKFIDRYLSDEKYDYIEDFKILIRNAKKSLEERYPFISMTKQHSVLSRAREDVQESVHMSSNPSRYDPAEIIRKATIGVEGLLYALLWKSSRKEPEGRDREFSPMLNNLREFLVDDFGKDLFDDLQYLNQMRNTVSHPGKEKPGPIDVIKTVRKADLFLHLIDKNYGYT